MYDIQKYFSRNLSKKKYARQNVKKKFEKYYVKKKAVNVASSANAAKNFVSP